MKYLKKEKRGGEITESKLKFEVILNA